MVTLVVSADVQSATDEHQHFQQRSSLSLFLLSPSEVFSLYLLMLFQSKGSSWGWLRVTHVGQQTLAVSIGVGPVMQPRNETRN